MNPLTKDETKVVNELWKWRDFDRRNGHHDNKAHIHRRQHLVDWLAADRRELRERAEHERGGSHKHPNWKPHRRGARFQIVHRAILFEKGGRVPHDDPIGVLALRAAATQVGHHETGYNSAPWLTHMENDLPHDRLDWMIPGNPYCGFGCIWSYWKGARVLLPDNFVGTMNICPANGHVYNGVRYTRTSPEHAHKGALVVYDFHTGHAEHVELARGPMKGGNIPTIGFNTSPGNGGSQANGGGVYYRVRSSGTGILCVVNVALA